MNNSHSTSPFDVEKWFEYLPEDAIIQVEKSAITDHLQLLMAKVGKMGIHIHVRYDPEREENNWTVIIDNSRWEDTDDPASSIKKYLQKRENQK